MRKPLVVSLLATLLLIVFLHSPAPARADSPQAVPAERGTLSWSVPSGAEPQALSLSLEHGIYYRLSDGIVVMGILRNTGSSNARDIQITIGLLLPGDSGSVNSGPSAPFLQALRPGESTPFVIKVEYYRPEDVVAVGITLIQAIETASEPAESVKIVNPQRIDGPGWTVVSGQLRNARSDASVRLGDPNNLGQGSGAQVAFFDQGGELVWIATSRDEALALGPGWECGFATGISYGNAFQVSRYEAWAQRGRLEPPDRHPQDPYILFAPSSRRWDGETYVVEGVLRNVGRLLMTPYTSIIYRDAQGRILDISRVRHRDLDECEQGVVSHADPYAPSGFATAEVSGVTDHIEFTPPPAQSPPPIAIDQPAQGAVVRPPSMVVSGWSIHINQGCSSGVDAIEVYIDPGENPQGQRLGSAQYGLARPDIAQAWGAWYLNSGYQATLNISGLAPGTYNLYVHAHSVFTGWHYQRRAIQVAPLASPTPSATPTITRTPTQTPTPTATRPLLPVGYLPVLLKSYVPPAPTPTATASPTTMATGTPTASPSPTSTEAATPTETSTEEPAPSETATATETVTATSTATSTATPTEGSGPAETSTPTVTRTPKNGALPTATQAPEHLQHSAPYGPLSANPGAGFDRLLAYGYKGGA